MNHKKSYLLVKIVNEWYNVSYYFKNVDIRVQNDIINLRTYEVQIGA